MPQYETYKESGAAWVGKIPSYWEVVRLKNYLKRTDARNPGGVQVLSLYRDLGIVPKDSRDDNHNVTSEDTSNYKHVEIGDFVVNKMKAWQGSVAVSEYEGIVSPAYYVYKFLNNKFHKRYFHYLIRSCYKDEFMRLSAGIRIGQWDLSSDDLDCTLVLIPPMEEQIVMSEFLDKKIAYIESLIEEAKASIEEYKAWKSSIIYETITKGLRSINSPIKTNNSKFPYIPQKWCVIRFKYLLSIKSGDSIQNEELIDNGDYPVYGGGERIGYANQYNCDDRNILIGRVGARCGFTTLLQSRAWATDNALIVNSNIYVKYLYYMLVAANLNTLNTSNAQPLITGTKIKNCMMPYTNDKSEQIEMVSFLDSRCASIDEIIDEKNKLIKDLEAYKKSLIFEVVTGKRKVV